MRALVTGGAGFIGSHLVRHLLKGGFEVRVLDNLSSGHRHNLDEVADQISFTEGDIRNAELLTELTAGCDRIFHQAAVVSVPYSVEHPQETHDVNIQGTFNVLQAARKNKVKRVVFASSAAIYGEEPVLPKVEEMRPAPVSPYGLEKLTGEHYLQIFHKLYGVETVALRYFNVFGPRQDPRSPYSGVISIFVDRILQGAGVTIFGDGEQYRDFVYIDNVVAANLLVAESESAAGNVYNVGCGAKTSLNGLVKILGDISGSSVEPGYATERAGDIRESLADISKLKALGYEAKVDAKTGLKALVDHIRAQ
jgi:UDP-glucose 4-epimerase